MKQLYAYLANIRGRHPGIVNHVLIFVHEEDGMTSNNVEEVILKKIPTDPFIPATINIISIKERISAFN